MFQFILLALLSCLTIVEGMPWNIYATQRRQACGDKLADIMSFVCSGRGYNTAFKPESTNSKRFRRGIVEECCHSSCSPTMLELYCLANPADVSQSATIRKRSDTGVGSTEEGVDAARTILPDSETVFKGSHSKISENGERNYKTIDILMPLSLMRQTKNHTEEGQSDKERNIPLIRHVKKHHGSTRHFHEHKPYSKTKRHNELQSTSEKETHSFEIGTIKPYFLGRALLAPYRNN